MKYDVTYSPSFPPGWMRFKDKCFIFKGKKDDIKANWSNARSWCKDQGGELAVIDDQYENGELNIQQLVAPGQRDFALYFDPLLSSRLCV